MLGFSGIFSLAKIRGEKPDLYWSRNIDWESILSHFRRHRHDRSAQGAWPRHGLFRCSWRGSSKAQGCQPEHQPQFQLPCLLLEKEGKTHVQGNLSLTTKRGTQNYSFILMNLFSVLTIVLEKEVHCAF